MRRDTKPSRSSLQVLFTKIFESRPVFFLRGTWERWQNDDGSLMAAAVAFYVGLSFFPLLLILIACLGFFFEYSMSGRDAQEYLLEVVSQQLSPTLSDHAAAALAQVRENASVGGPTGFAALLFAGMALFAHFDRAFDRIWNVGEPESEGIVSTLRTIVTRRLSAFLTLTGLAAVLIVIFCAGLVMSALQSYSQVWLPLPGWAWNLTQFGVTFVLNCMVFTLIYRLLPKVDVRWVDALRGAVFAAVIWEIGRLVLASLLIGNKYSSAYGVVGAFIAILLWSYYSVSVIFLGAEFIQTIRHKIIRPPAPAAMPK